MRNSNYPLVMATISFDVAQKIARALSNTETTQAPKQVLGADGKTLLWTSPCRKTFRASTTGGQYIFVELANGWLKDAINKPVTFLQIFKKKGNIR